LENSITALYMKRSEKGRFPPDSNRFSLLKCVTQPLRQDGDEHGGPELEMETAVIATGRGLGEAGLGGEGCGADGANIIMVGDNDNQLCPYLD
jgi:hypothetical protein